MTPVWLDNLTAVAVTDRCVMSTQRYLVNGQPRRRGANRQIHSKLAHSHSDTRTSGSCAGVQRQAGGSSPEDLLLGLGPFFLLITLLLSLGQTELEWKKQQTDLFFLKCIHEIEFMSKGDYRHAHRVGLFWRIELLYLFGRVGRLGEDGLPVRPHKHDEREVEENQVDDWRENIKQSVRTDGT